MYHWKLSLYEYTNNVVYVANIFWESAVDIYICKKTSSGDGNGLARVIQLDIPTH